MDHTNIDKKKKSVLIITIVAVCLSVLLVSVISVMIVMKIKGDNSGGTETSGTVSSSVLSSEPSDTVSSTAPPSGTEGTSVVTSQTAGTTSTSRTETTPAESKESATTTTAPSVPSVNYDPTSDRDTNFSGCLFIGNSRTEGLMLYSGVKGATAYAARGMSLPSYFSSPAIKLNGATVTASEAVEKGPDYDRVYIMLGINEIGWLKGDPFYESYEKVIDHVRENMPEAEIIVQSIIPVTATRSTAGDAFNNENISEHNAIIKKLCADKGITFIDLTPALCGKYNALPEDAASDGIHLQKSYCQMWLDYLKKN